VIERQMSFEALDDLFLRKSVIIESEDSLLRFILNLGSGYRFLLRHIQLDFLSSKGISLLARHFEIPPEVVWKLAAEVIGHPHSPPLPGPFNSLIFSGCPGIFAEFRRKQFKLLWRGSWHGFKAKDFHLRCDGHTKTLTVILDTDGNIFAGVEWAVLGREQLQ
jgi:hypothetical protein